MSREPQLVYISWNPTSGNGPKLLQAKLVNYSNHSDRVWLRDHLTWCMYHGVEVHLVPATEADESDIRDAISVINENYRRNIQLESQHRPN